MKIEMSTKVLLSIITLSVIVTILVTGYKFLWEKDYNFVVEASCNPEVNNCFYRDCSIEGDCPPNNFSNYRIYEIHASEFSKCSNNSCERECESGVINCSERLCSVENGDECTTIEPPEFEESSGSLEDSMKDSPESIN